MLQRNERHGGGGEPNPIAAVIDEDGEEHDENLAYMAQHGGSTDQP